jgi:diguanylate cyclase (GGDEF)-like protein
MEAGMTAAGPPRLRVLIAEHGGSAGIDLAFELEQLRYEVCGTVATAEAAVEAAARTRPEIVLLWLRLADGSDGVEAARRIVAVHEAVIMFVAAAADAATLSRAFEVSAHGYLLEPFDARELAAAIELARARQARDAAISRRYAALAATDPLTGLPNRRGLDEALALEWRRCRRAGAPLTVLLIDIDRFKAINDAHGHVAGDDWLVAVAASLLTCCRRAGDVLGRWGGDEFLAVLPATDVAGRRHVAERMMRAVREVRIASAPPVPASAPVTVSMGLATVVPGPADEPRSLIERAARDLRLAKKHGREGGIADTA